LELVLAKDRSPHDSRHLLNNMTSLDPGRCGARRRLDPRGDMHRLDGGNRRHDLAVDQPIEQMPQRGR
jgi:hypothetical protein